MNTTRLSVPLLGFALLSIHACKYPPEIVGTNDILWASGVVAQNEMEVDDDRDGIAKTSNPDPSDKPNILLIMADDMGFNDLSINNDNPNIHTPNLDQIAKDGVRFTRHYAAAVCAPGRAALLSGLFPERLGFVSNAAGISPQVVTLAERLAQENYTTWHLGKWHLGYEQRAAWPDHQGFDHWLGFLTSDFLAGAQAKGNLVLRSPRYQNPWLQGDTEPGRYFSGHLTDILTDQAIGVLTKLHAAGSPWFLNLWYFAPHGPFTPSEQYAALYPDSDAGRYRALIHQLDANIGRVLDTLEALGILDKTIVVIVSDNGGTNRQLDNNAPYFGSKTPLTEGGLRTPLIIRWPNQSLNRQVIADPVIIQDLYPTLLAAAGIEIPPNLDGRNLYPFIQRLEKAPRKEIFWQVSKTSYGMLSAEGRYRFYQPAEPFGLPLALYDLHLDPTGTQLVVPIPPALLTQFLTQYREWFIEVYTVATEYLPNTVGGGILQGMDFQRTPGTGRYTFGIGVPDTYNGPLVAQEGVWEMIRSGDLVTVQLSDHSLSGHITAAGDCHSVILTGHFARRSLFYGPPDRIMVSLYIDGLQVDTIDVNAALRVPDASLLTYIGDPQATKFSGHFTPPVVLSEALDSGTPLTVQEFSQAFCPPERAKGRMASQADL